MSEAIDTMKSASQQPVTTLDAGIAANSMQYRRLGRTQLRISMMGFGSSPLGDVFGATVPSEGNRAVALAIDEGVNFFDVSPYYGITLAEERLGQALDGKRSKVVLATKCGRYGKDTFDFSAASVTSSLEASLKRLRTDYVDMFQAHDVEFGDIEQIIQETIPTMRRLQEQGKARYIGITGYPLKPLIRILEAVPVDSVLSYCRYNLLNDDMNSVLIPVTDKHEIGVINASPLYMGALTNHGAPEWHPASKEVRAAAQKAAKFCRDNGCDLAKMALQFCFRSNRVASTLVGMSTTEQVRKNLHALTTPVDEEMMNQVSAILAPVYNNTWPSGRQNNQD